MQRHGCPPAVSRHRRFFCNRYRCGAACRLLSKSTDLIRQHVIGLIAEVRDAIHRPGENDNVNPVEVNI